MRLHSSLALAFLVLSSLAAQSPDPRALAAQYATLLKDYPRLVKEKQRLPLELNLESLYARVVREKDPQTRQVLLVARQLMVQARMPDMSKLPKEAGGLIWSLENSLGIEMAAQIPPDSPGLDLVAAVKPELLGFIAWHASGGGFVNQKEEEAARKAFEYFDQVFEKHPTREVRVLALVSGAELNSRPRRIAEVKAYVDRLEAFDPQNPAIANWRGWIEKAKVEDLRVPKVGRKVPAFTLADLDRPGQRLSPATFKGRYLLLDFWATWCGPCKAELPNLHAAYARFKDRGLEVLSISWDKKASDIADFRKDKAHPMPWRHAFPQGKEAAALNATFQVRAIPHALLIGPDGTILASGEDLRGDKLGLTLDEKLPPGK